MVKYDHYKFYPSSKTCHKCGYVNKELNLKDRYWVCPHCKAELERDLNAAINILLAYSDGGRSGLATPIRTKGNSS